MAIAALLAIPAGPGPESRSLPDAPSRRFQPEPLKIRPTLPAVNAPSDFSPPQNAYDGWATAALASAIRHCKWYCSGVNSAETIWSGFPSGYRPQRLVVSWRATSIMNGLIMPPDVGTVRATISYRTGGGAWQLLDEFTRTNVNFDTGYVEKDATLPEELDPATVEVRATFELDLICNTNCAAILNWSHAGGQAMVNDIYIEVVPNLTVSPNPITRGETGTFTISGVPEGNAKFWRYETTNPSVGTISRTTDTTSLTWSGPIVASGNVLVSAIAPATAVVAEQLYPLPIEELIVSPRSGWFSEARPADKVAPGTTGACGVLNVNVPDICVSGQAPSGVGRSQPCLTWDPKPEQVPNGPNQGIWWLPDLIDNTFYRWAIHPNVENPGSDYCAHQCGDWTDGPGSTCQTPVGSGYTDCARLAAAITRHESSPVQNSHYVQYVQAQNNPSNNIRAGAEAIVGYPFYSEAAFRGMVESRLASRRTAIMNATAPEPCGLCSDDCTVFWGRMNCRLSSTTWLKNSCTAEDASTRLQLWR